MEIKYDQESEALRVKNSLLSENSNLSNQINLGDTILLNIKRIVILLYYPLIKQSLNFIF